VADAKSILGEFPGKIPIPIDVVCAKEFAESAKPELKLRGSTNAGYFCSVALLRPVE